MGLRISRAVALATFAALVFLAPAANASQLIARDAQNPILKVDRAGRALVTYTDAKGPHRLLAWNAINDQVEFKLDYSGGWGTFRKPIWKTLKDTCTPYDGPPLAWLVVACKAPDGSYWALQRWQRSLPVWGRISTTPIQNSWDLRLSHWTGELPKLEVWQEWVYSVRLENVIFRLTYLGKPVFGFKSTAAGSPLDPYGRNIYVDTFNSAYGRGWQRANGLLTHNPTGALCMAFASADFLPDQQAVNHGRGERYRATVGGPGVTPDAFWEGAAIGAFDGNNPEHQRIEATVRPMVISWGETDKRCTTE